MTLFVMTLALNIFSFWFVRRFRQKYDWSSQKSKVKNQKSNYTLRADLRIQIL
jgi:purine-cytosine permease-like protein